MDTLKLAHDETEKQMKALKLIIDLAVKPAFLPTFNCMLRSALHGAATSVAFELEEHHFKTLKGIADGSKEFVDTGGDVSLKAVK